MKHQPENACSLLINRLTHCSATPLGKLEARSQKSPPRDALVGFNAFSKPMGIWLAVDDWWILVSMRYGKRFTAEHFGSTSMRSRSFCMYRAHAPSANVVVWTAGLKKPNFAECEAGRCADKLLLLDASTVEAFHRRYRVAPMPNQADREAVDWEQVAKHFAGICVLASKHVLSACRLLWLQLWELPSACVWRPHALQLTLHQLPDGDVRARVARCAALLAKR